MLEFNDFIRLPIGAQLGTGVCTEPLLYKDEIRWIAVKGGGEDWALYYHHSYHPLDYVRTNGDKAFTESVIRKLVPCDEEVIKRYRY